MYNIVDSVSVLILHIIFSGHESDDSPLEVSYRSNRNATEIEEGTPNESAKKKKKKNKKGLNTSISEELMLFGKEC